SSDENVEIAVAPPLDDFITGGGYIVLSNSAGMKAGDAGKKNNFGFNVKYNRSGRNLQGNINTIIRRTETDGLHVYQVKGNAMTSLSVTPSGSSASPSTPFSAVFNGKANIQDITDPLNIIAIDGNATLQVSMDDKGEPGNLDSISITVWNKNGGLWFSSNWNGVKTTDKVLSGGNVAARCGRAIT